LNFVICINYADLHNKGLGMGYKEQNKLYEIYIDGTTYKSTGRVKLGWSNNGRNDWHYFEVRCKAWCRRWVREDQWYGSRVLSKKAKVA